MRRTVTPPYTVVADDEVLWVTGVAGGVVTLPSPVNGRVLRIKRMLGAGVVTLLASAGNIEGDPSVDLAEDGEAEDLIGDGAIWGRH